MKVTVLGTGTVGRALADRLAELGHEVTVATRDVTATMAHTDPDGMGIPPYRVWADAHPAISLVPFAGSLVGADLVVNATSGSASIAALTEAGAAQQAGTVLLDIANPLDFSNGFPPTLFVDNTDSLGERIQAAFPGVAVVKALNTLAADLMVHPRQLADGAHSVFVAGDDAGAKKMVTELLRSFGHTDIIDVGDIASARGTEMLLPIWLRLMNSLGTQLFNFKVVR